MVIDWWQLIGGNWLVKWLFLRAYFSLKRYGPQPIAINQLLHQSIATHQLLLLLLLAHLGPMLVHLGPMLCLLWPILDPSWAYVRPFWGYVNPLDLSWGSLLAHFGVHFEPFALTRAYDSKKIDYARAGGAHYRHHPLKIYGFCISPLSKLWIIHAHKTL